MITDNFLIFIILFVLMYCFKDSFFATFILFWAALIQAINIINSPTNTTIIDLMLFIVLTIYALLELIEWANEWNTGRKMARKDIDD